MRRVPKWLWVPPPNWPVPPPGWAPSAGWMPDPAWGPPPVGHLWWRRNPVAVRRRRRVFIAMGTVLALILGGCVVGTIIVGPCFFDPPPGDYSSLEVINDRPTETRVADWC